MTDRIEIDYAQIDKLIKYFRTSAESYKTRHRLLARMVDELETEWIGRGSQAFQNEMRDIALPAMNRLATNFDTIAQVLHQVAVILRQAEEAGSRLFMSEGGFLGGLRTAIGNLMDATATDKAKLDAIHKRLSDYVTGDGWTFTPNAGFTFGEQLEQIGGSCVIYGAMNLLVHEGIDISPEKAEEILDRMAERYGTRSGFPVQAAKDILDEYGVEYEHGNFRNKFLGKVDLFSILDIPGATSVNFFGGADESAARDFLVNQLKQGNSVYVRTEVDDTFGMGSGGHGYTVVGLQENDKGEATNVLVSTNWGKGFSTEHNVSYDRYMQIPMDKFMKDWIERRGGDYIVLK